MGRSSHPHSTLSRAGRAAPWLAARVALVTAAGVFAAPSAAPVAAEEAAPRDHSAALESIRAEHDLPALVGVTLAADRIVAQGACGVRRRGGEEKVTVDDPMHLGSCTKAMTATLCAVLVAEGKLAWDARPVETLARDREKADPAWKDATLERLLRNRGGAPKDLDADGVWMSLWSHRGPPRAAREALAAAVFARPPVAKPGTKFEYSNAGFSIAGALAERAEDVAWEDLVRRRLFEPLGMTTAGFGAPGTPKSVDAPRGHRANGTPVEPGPGSDNPDAIAPAGKVHASLPDWAKFVGLHLRRGKGHEAFAKVDFEKLQTPAPGEDYAMGWAVAERPWARGTSKGDRGRVLTHAGSNTMWYAVAWIAPERDLAVLVATNQGGDAATKGCDAAAGTLIRAHVEAVR